MRRHLHRQQKWDSGATNQATTDTNLLRLRRPCNIVNWLRVGLKSAKCPPLGGGSPRTVGSSRRWTHILEPSLTAVLPMATEGFS